MRSAPITLSMLVRSVTFVLLIGSPAYASTNSAAPADAVGEFPVTESIATARAASPIPAGRITGTIIDRATGEALVGANVIVSGTGIGAATDIEGRYTIPSAPSGEQTLVASYIGYQRQEQVVQVPDGGMIEVDFELDWAGVEGEEILITAQASGQMGAINQQLSSNTITNIVSRARIQELPDVNAAESIGRLPGVSIQRSGGEATKVAIRGLSPKYNTVSVNGVRVPSTGGDDRSVDLSLISSNMLDGIEVKKAITPDMDADAIGGAVDLRLRNAPEGLKFDILAQGGYNRLQEHYGNYKVAGTVSNRFLGDKLGIIANFNLDEYDRSADKLSAGYRQSTDAATSEDIIIVQDVGLREESVTRSRRGASMVLDYAIPGGKVSGNTFFNRLHSESLNRVNNMNVNNNRHYYQLQSNSGETSIFTGAIGVEQNFNWIRYDASVARSRSFAESPNNYQWQFSQEGNAFTAAPDRDTQPRDIPAMARVDSMTALSDIYRFRNEREENVTSAQLNVQMPFRFGNAITGYLKTGGKFRWLDRFNDEEQDGRGGLQYGSGAGSLSAPYECIAAQLPDWNLEEIIGDLGILPIGLVLSDHTRDDFLAGDYELGFTPKESMMADITNAMFSDGCTSEWTSPIPRNMAIGSRGRDYEGEERYEAGYVMAELNLGSKLTLIPGIRWESDYSRYQGQRYREVVVGNVQQEPADLDTLINVRENAFWLPMVQLQYEPTSWLQVRLARTETLTRPDYIQYAPITTINNFRTYVRAANATLRPAHSTNYDASLSIYENHVGLFTVSAFQKNIEDLILWVDYYLHPEVGALPGMNIPEVWINDRPQANTYINNPFEAEYRGVEFDWQTNFWYLPSFLKGLVLNVNYTHIFSETTYQGFYLTRGDSLIRQRPPLYNTVLRTDSVRVGRMPDQPSDIANVTLGYDFKGFSTRFSVLYQTNTSTFVHATNSLFDNFSGDYLRLDLSARQKLRSGLEIFANFNNLNGRPDRNFRGAENANPSYIEYYGFTMDVGARYRF